MTKNFFGGRGEERRRTGGERVFSATSLGNHITFLLLNKLFWTHEKQLRHLQNASKELNYVCLVIAVP